MARHSKKHLQENQQFTQKNQQQQRQQQSPKREQEIQGQERMQISLPRLPSFRVPSFFQMPSWFDDFGNAWNQLVAEQQTGLSVSEDDKNVYIEAHLPGLRSQDIDISLDNGVLWVRGERREEQNQPERKYHFRSSNVFSYRLPLPNQVDASKEPKATYKDGLMKITFAKSNVSKSKKIQVRAE